MKTLYLARHAKSSWNFATTDYQRPLNKRGEADAIIIAEEMKRQAWQPQTIIASPAQRVKQTCNTYCEVLGFQNKNVIWNPDIYEAYTVSLLQIITQLDESTDSAMLIGHNPSLDSLLLHLCGPTKVEEFKQGNGKLFTTANVAKLTTASSWQDLIFEKVKLESLLRPKEL